MKGKRELVLVLDNREDGRDLYVFSECVILAIDFNRDNRDLTEE